MREALTRFLALFFPLNDNAFAQGVRDTCTRNAPLNVYTFFFGAHAYECGDTL